MPVDDLLEITDRVRAHQRDPVDEKARRAGEAETATLIQVGLHDRAHVGSPSVGPRPCGIDPALAATPRYCTPSRIEPLLMAEEVVVEAIGRPSGPAATASYINAAGMASGWIWSGVC